MSNRNQKLSIATKIEEEPFETQESSVQKPSFKANSDIQFAFQVTTLPEMPESAKSIAKQYMESHIEKQPTGFQLSNSGSSKNLSNRSYSSKTLNNQLKPIAESLPKMNSRLKEITVSQQQFQNVSLDQSKTPNVAQTSYNPKEGFRNIKISKNKVSQRSEDKLSPLPDIYKEYLPHIIKKQIGEVSRKPSQLVTLTNFQKQQKSTQALTTRKHSMQQLSVENLRQDVSYLKEGTNPTQPTILTTGDRQKDEFLGVALGVKNIGSSLIDLPQTLDQLQTILLTYDTQFQAANKEDGEEKLFERYLNEHFNPTDLLKDRGMSLLDYANATQQSQFTSKFLKNQKYSPNRMFNVNERNLNRVLKNDRIGKVNTKPETLALISNKIIKKHGKAAIWQSKTRNQLKNQELQVSQSSKDLDMKGLREKLFKTIDESMQNESMHVKNLNEMNTNRDTSAPKIGAFLTPKTILTSTHSQQSLGNPSSRQDALILLSWMDKMLVGIHKELNQETKDEQMFHLIQLVFNMAIQEVSRQVSVHCIERGQILKRIFHAYISLIDMIHKSHKIKRKNLKMQYAEKLDKYVGIQEDQIKQVKDQIEEYKQNYDRLKRELDNYLFRLNQSNILNNKFKKKLYNVSKDLEAAQKKVKLLEKEKLELQEKVQDLADKLGEEVSTIDEKDQMKIMEAIEQEFEIEKMAEATEQDIELIPDKEIIKEDDKFTDMHDFEEYLTSIYGEKTATTETQTEKVSKRHIKLGVTVNKLGIISDKETQVDARMLLQKGVVKMTYVAEEQGPDLICEEDEQPDGLLVEEDQLSDDNNPDRDNTLNLETDLNLTQEQVEDGIEYQSIKRPRSSRGRVTIEIDNLEGAEETYNKFQTSKIHKRSKRRNSISGSELNKLQQVTRSMLDKSGRPSQAGEGGHEEPFSRRTTMLDAFAEKIRQKIQSMLQNELVKQLGEMNPEMYSQLEQDLKEAQQDVTTMELKIKKQSKQVKFQTQEMSKKESVLELLRRKADILEMDNYMLREQVANILDLTEEQKNEVDQILGMLERQEIGEVTIEEIRKHLNALGDKLQGVKNNKTLMQLLEEKTVWNESLRETKMNFSQDDNTGKAKTKGTGTETQEIMTIDKKNAVPILNIQGMKIEDGEEMEPEPNQNDNIDNRESFVSKRQGGSSLRRQNSQKRSRAPFKFALFNVGKRKSPQRRGAHPAYQLLKKVQSKNPKDLKDLMPRKMMLRVITQIYQERPPFTSTENNPQTSQTQFNQSNALSSQATTINASQNLLEWVYDFFLQKYGLKNVAEKKFIQLLSTCVLQKDYMPRIRLFGRFMEIYDELTPQDYNKYLEITDWFILQVLNFKIDGDEEKVLIPFYRAIDYFKLKFEARFIASAFTHRVQKLERMKVIVSSDLQKTCLHLKGIREAIDYDKYVEFLIDNMNMLQEEKEKMIKDFFLASDLDNDGLLSLSEFQLAMKIFHSRPSSESARIFEENCEIGIDEANPGIKYLTVQSFLQLSLDKEYFMPKQQLVFINSKNYEQDFLKLQDLQDQVISQLRRRVSEIELEAEGEILNMISSLENFLKDPYSSRVGLLRYRIVDKTIKRACINTLTEFYMPVNLKLMGVKAIAAADRLQNILSFVIGSDI